MKRMGWSWLDYVATPHVVVEAALIDMHAEGSATAVRMSWENR